MPTAIVALKVLLVLVVTCYLAIQVRKPSRWVGLPFAWLMNLSHSRLTDWGFRHVHIDIKHVQTVLDVGCGGGRTIQKLAALAVAGKVYGIDYAAGSVAASRAKNAASIRAGRVEIVRASVSKIPFPDDMFDVATAIETQYYWPDVVNDMKEIRRVLKPGGTLVIIAETYRNGKNNKVIGSFMKALGSPNLSVEDHEKLFADAGYTDIKVVVEDRKGWICAMGSKGNG